MLTKNDRLAREVLIHTHARFADPKRWTQGAYTRESRAWWKPGGARCMMGEIAAQLGVAVTPKQIKSAKSETRAVYDSIAQWFYTLPETQRGAERFNDASDLLTVRAFLTQRIADLDAELIKDAPVMKTGIRQMMMAGWSIFVG